MANIVDTYFQENDDSPAGLARKVGVSPSTITRAIKGERQPSFELAGQIETATGGKLTAKDFIAACMDAMSAKAGQSAPVEAA